MPHPNREREIITAIRKHLKVARKGSEPITDGSLMTAAKCSRKTFYKYVKEGSKIRREIDDAETERKNNSSTPVGGPRRRDCAGINKELRAELEQTKKGNRELLGKMAQLLDNLKRRGVEDEVIQWALETPMIKPVRHVSHAGRSRRKKR